METNLNKDFTVKDAINNFAEVIKTVDKIGSAIISEDNTPKYMLIPYRENVQTAPDELVKSVALRFIDKNKAAYEELAK